MFIPFGSAIRTSSCEGVKCVQYSRPGPAGQHVYWELRHCCESLMVSNKPHEAILPMQQEQSTTLLHRWFTQIWQPGAEDRFQQIGLHPDHMRMSLKQANSLHMPAEYMQWCGVERLASTHGVICLLCHLGLAAKTMQVRVEAKRVLADFLHAVLSHEFIESAGIQYEVCS